VGAGSSVANIGDSHESCWARLARIRIVAEIPHNIYDVSVGTPLPTEVDRFWKADDGIKWAVLRALSETGAKITVARGAPSVPRGWQQIAGTHYVVYCFK
jgi:hypothetical protein